ncbi:hypothetical protein PR202_ga00465 [Eleusine coracana subsp. coracana]|uniref:Uncharacterized protein n=1 Tax=Eleusine coracana subsp. coracana TaxID=191504 RepID=A0AAV5BDB5_ELECO|nr:hypothetical protein PR202_ga00465 [Eleusine coracana subsp. coracana]
MYSVRVVGRFQRVGGDEWKHVYCERLRFLKMSKTRLEQRTQLAFLLHRHRLSDSQVRKIKASMASLLTRNSGGATMVGQLLRRLRSTWRKRATTARSRRAAAARFGYDLQSYSRNFDDGNIAY